MKNNALQRTQLYSEDVFQVLMDYEIIRTIRYTTPLSLIYIEITPQALNGSISQSTSSIFETAINSRLRSVDIPTHHENGYLILLPMTNEDGAHAVRERLLSIFDKEYKTEEDKPVKFSLQIGVASHNGGPTLMKETLLQSAKSNIQ